MTIFPLDLSCCFLNRVHLQYPQHVIARTSTTSLRTVWKPTSVVYFKPPCLMDTPSSCIGKAEESCLWIVPGMNLGGFFSTDFCLEGACFSPVSSKEVSWEKTHCFKSSPWKYCSQDRYDSWRPCFFRLQEFFGSEQSARYQVLHEIMPSYFLRLCFTLYPTCATGSCC